MMRGNEPSLRGRGLGGLRGRGLGGLRRRGLGGPRRRVWEKLHTDLRNMAKLAMFSTRHSGTILRVGGACGKRRKTSGAGSTPGTRPQLISGTEANPPSRAGGTKTTCRPTRSHGRHVTAQLRSHDRQVGSRGRQVTARPRSRGRQVIARLRPCEPTTGQ